LMSFSHWGQNTIPLSVIPAKAGTQIRGVAVDCAFLMDFPLVFPFSRLWIPAFAGMTKGGKSWESGQRSGKRAQHKTETGNRARPQNFQKSVNDSIQ